MDPKEREAWTRIIEVYKDRPHMWDKTHEKYFDRKLRQKAFGIMFEIYQKYGQLDIKISTFKKKLENMRTSYSREFKKVIKQTGSGNVYTPSLWYYDLFAFYGETIQPCRARIDTFDSEETSQNFDDETSGSDQETSSRIYKTEDESTSSRKRRKSLQQQKEKSFLASNSDDWEVIGKSIGLQLRDLSQHQQTIAQKLIADAIYYARLEKLTEESFITLKKL